MKIIAIIVALVLTGCDATDISLPDTSSSVSTSNPSLSVMKLGEADGCKIYEVRHSGVMFYFARCGINDRTMNAYEHSCGKGCMRTEYVEAHR
jgi:hypothetical protein